MEQLQFGNDHSTQSTYHSTQSTCHSMHGSMHDSLADVDLGTTNDDKAMQGANEGHAIAQNTPSTNIDSNHHHHHHHHAFFSRPPSIDVVAATSCPSSAPTRGYSSITVGTPSRVKGISYLPGMSESHVEYPIQSTRGAEDGGISLWVLRRFKDVVALSERLISLLVPLGVIVPPRPRRDAVEGGWRMSQVFIDRRKVAIERWLTQLNRHPVITTTRGGDNPLPYQAIDREPAVRAARESFRIFLEASGEMRGSESWTTATNATSPSPPISPSPLPQVTTTFLSFSGILSALGSGAGAIKQAVSSAIEHKKTLPMIPLERHLREEGLRLTELSSLLLSLRSKKGDLLAAMSKKASVLTDLSKALQALRGYEKALNKGLGRYATRIETSLEQPMRPELALSDLIASASSLTQLSHDHLSVPFSTIDYHLRMSESALATLRYRENLLAELGTIETDLGKARTALSIAENTPSQFSMREYLNSNVTLLEGREIQIKMKYSQVAEMNALELSRMRGLMAAEFQNMLLETVVVQSASAQKGSQVWSGTPTDAAPHI